MAFIYLWRDRSRNMYYVGSHVGKPDDGYVSSSKWLNGEIQYRPQDFRRRVLKFVRPEMLRREEHAILKKIKRADLGRKYYNMPTGREKGIVPWNKGRPASPEYCAAIGRGVREGKARAKRARAEALAGSIG